MCTVIHSIRSGVWFRGPSGIRRAGIEREEFGNVRLVIQVGFLGQGVVNLTSGYYAAFR